MRTKHIIIVLYILAELFLHVDLLASEKPIIAIMDIVARKGVSESETLILTDFLYDAVFNTMVDKIVLIDRDKRDEILKESEFALSDICDTADCAVRLGRFLAADYIIFGNFMKFGTNFHIVLRLVDIGTTEVVGSVRDKALNLDGIEKILTKSVGDLFSKTDIEGELTLLRFKYEKNEKYRLFLVVNETVYVNGRMAHKANIENNIEVEVLDTKDNFAFIESRFIVTDRLTGERGSLTNTQEYNVSFWRNELGKYRIDASAFMPVVRDVPLFPEKAVAVGDSWKAPAEEVHDFRRNFGIDTPFRIPIIANYKYIRKEYFGGREIAVLNVSYIVDQEVMIRTSSQVYPKRIKGKSEQTLYWDIINGRLYSSQDTFDFTFILSNGDSVSYRGESRGSTIE